MPDTTIHGGESVSSIRRSATIYRALALLSGIVVALALAPPAQAWTSWDVGDLRRVSTTQGGVAFYAISEGPALSADGRFVVFFSGGNLLPDLDANVNIFRRNLATGQLRLVSANDAGDPADRNSFEPDISADGRFVVFQSTATNLTPLGPEQHGIFVKDMVTGHVDMVSVSTDGAPANADTWSPTLTPDASRVAFASDATNLTDAEDNGWSDIFLVNRAQDTIRVVSTDTAGEPANNNSNTPVIANGGSVIFQSLASDLSANDEDGCVDLFVWQTDGSRRLIDLPCSRFPPSPYTISGDGRVVAYGQTVLTLATGSRWTPKAHGFVSALSTTGRLAAFLTSARLVHKDTNKLYDIYLRDLKADTWQLATVSSGGEIATKDGSPHEPSLSGDASYIAFASGDSDLVNGDDNRHHDIFVARLR